MRSVHKRSKRLKRRRILTVQQFQSQFSSEEQCLQYLSIHRWPQGFVCPRCGGGSRGYMRAKRVHECRSCGYQGSVTAGTLFHKTRVSLRGWFWALYRMSQDKKGISALQLSKEIGVSYPTARGSSGILCVNRSPLGEGMKAPAIFHRLGHVSQAAIG